MACIACLNARKAGVSCHAVRFEARGKEFISMASLSKRGVAKANSPQLARGMGTKVPESLG